MQGPHHGDCVCQLRGYYTVLLDFGVSSNAVLAPRLSHGTLAKYVQSVCASHNIVIMNVLLH